MADSKKKVVSVTRKDVRWEYFRSGGAGGQRRDKTSTAVRCTHDPSGAVGQSQDQRNQSTNRQLAFRRMAESEKFQIWAKRVASGDQALESEIQAEVERQIRPHNLKVETFEDGEWVSDDRD